MGLISPGGENILDFLELRQMLSTYDGTSETRFIGLRKGQSHASCAGPLGIPLPSMQGLRPCVEWVPEPEDSSPVLT